MTALSLVKKIFGSRNQRLLKRMGQTVKQINALEETWQKLSDSELENKTAEFKNRYQQGEDLNALLPEAFATVREAAKRTLNMRHFDVQLLGGMALHGGKISEMHTGEGKTLVATLAAYLNALSGKGVHVITVNDYLAKRDAEWMGPIYQFLGLTVGTILSQMEKEEKRAAYGADITYGTNNEFGFDYLRDNMVFSNDERVQRDLNFAIIDEVDSILIDEARTPLIISGPVEDSSEMYKAVDRLIPLLSRQAAEDGEGDYSVDEKSKQVFLTEAGHERIEQLLVDDGLLKPEESLYATSNITLLHHVNAALKAHTLFTRDIDYIVRNNEVVIVDEHTGRTMPGRRWSDGLHQAVEAKESVHINNENQTLASITFQNYFRLYSKLSGMTGTADTEAYEFHQIYGLEVVVMPTNRINQRDDKQDLVFMTADAKFQAVLKDVRDCVERGQPVLVGTASIETSEYLSQLLNKDNITHQVLNAKFHASEAQVIAQAGRPGAVTIATNMAGRGTDIVLGGNPEVLIQEMDNPGETEREAIKKAWQADHEKVLAAGGLHVIGSERHESRRIDNQLRGRSGRQGDPGSTRFYLSLEDDLMRIFASPNMVALMRKLHDEPTQPLESNLLSRGIENAQRKVEGRNFDIRKQLLEFDDVANEQRKVIYGLRSELMSADDVSSNINNLRGEVVETLVRKYIPENTVDEQWDVASLQKQLEADFALDLAIQQWLDENTDQGDDGLIEKIIALLEESYRQKEQMASAEVLRNFEKAVMLQSLDHYWKEHLAAMDHLRQAVGLRGYAQKDPKQEYKRESFNLFQDMLNRLKTHIISTVSAVKIQAEDVEAIEEQRRKEAEVDMDFQHGAASALAMEGASEGAQAAAQKSQEPQPYVRVDRKQGRNELCQCGSGRKYKHCHGQIA